MNITARRLKYNLSRNYTFNGSHLVTVTATPLSDFFQYKSHSFIWGRLNKHVICTQGFSLMRFLQNINWNRSMKIAFLMPPIILPWKPESTVYFVPWRGNEATQKANLMRHSYWYVVCYDAKIRENVTFIDLV